VLSLARSGFWGSNPIVFPAPGDFRGDVCALVVQGVTRSRVRLPHVRAASRHFSRRGGHAD